MVSPSLPGAQVSPASPASASASSTASVTGSPAVSVQKHHSNHSESTISASKDVDNRLAIKFKDLLWILSGFGEIHFDMQSWQD